MVKPQTHSSKDPRFHILKAERNEEFYRKYDMSSMDAATFNEWAVVVLFYTSLHYIDAILSQDDSLPDDLRDPADHRTRNRALSRCSRLSVIIKTIYLNMYQRSRDARYRIICFPNDFICKFETYSFKPLREHIRRQLGLS